MPKPSTVQGPATLLNYLFTTWPEVKKSQIRTWLKSQAVTVNDQPLSQFDHPLKLGDVVAIRTHRFATPNLSISGGMRVRFEDAHIIVIEKPSGLRSIASEAESEKTAYFQLNEYLRHGNPRARERVWIVHRLDRHTSGLMVFAKSSPAQETLQASWDTCKKLYQAVIYGRLPLEKGTFESDLNESNPLRVHSAPRSERTRHAVTHYRVLAKGEAISLLELRLETGRRHQIRVQLSDAGCPIVGDTKYGAQTNPAGRLALHACVLSFAHPITRQALYFESPMPPKLVALVR